MELVQVEYRLAIYLFLGLQSIENGCSFSSYIVVSFKEKKAAEMSGQLFSVFECVVNSTSSTRNTYLIYIIIPETNDDEYVFMNNA